MPTPLTLASVRMPIQYPSSVASQRSVMWMSMPPWNVGPESAVRVGRETQTPVWPVDVDCHPSRDSCPTTIQSNACYPDEAPGHGSYDISAVAAQSRMPRSWGVIQRTNELRGLFKMALEGLHRHPRPGRGMPSPGNRQNPEDHVFEKDRDARRRTSNRQASASMASVPHPSAPPPPDEPDALVGGGGGFDVAVVTVVVTDAVLLLALGSG